MAHEIARRLVDGVWRTVDVEEDSGGGGNLPDPSGEPDGDVLTVASGAAVWAPSGGSQPVGPSVSADILFTEQAVAGVYTATLDVEAGTVVEDVRAWLLASWKADTGWFGVIDSGGSYFDPTAHTIGNDQGNYDPLDPQNGATVFMLSVNASTDGYGKAQAVPYSATSSTTGPGRYYATADTITITIDTSDSTPETLDTTGRFLVRIVYRPPVTADAATFEAAA